MGQPIVSWYEFENKKENEIVESVNHGTVDADSDSQEKVFYIWNNRNGDEDVSKMEEVTYTTRDRLGGVGDTTGNIVEAVRDNWFQVRVDSLDETAVTPVGKGEVPSNPSGVKALGTEGSTTNPNASEAVIWEASTAYEEGAYIKPTVDNEFIYRVTDAGTSGSAEPIWSQTDGNIVGDGTIEYVAIPIERKPAAQEILGVANNVDEDGSNAENAGGNFVKITVYAEVPISASAGRNLFQHRVN